MRRMHPDPQRTGKEPGKTGNKNSLHFRDNYACVLLCIMSIHFFDSSTHLASVARYTISQAVPHLVQLFHNPDEISARTPTTFLLSELIASARDSMDKASSLMVEPPLLPFKDEVLGVLTAGSSLPATRTVALSGLKALVSTKGLLSDEELGFIVHNADQIIEGGTDYGDSRSSLSIILIFLKLIFSLSAKRF